MPLMSDMHARHLNGIDLNLLVALDAMLGEGSVTKAARRLGVTQSAMSHALGRLRALLDDPLFVRTPRAMLPTPRARALTQPLRRVLDDVRAVISSGPTFDPATATRAFSIGTADYGALVILPALMARVSREAPGVEIVMRPSPGSGRDGDEIEKALADETIDLVLSPYPESRASMVRRKLFEERFVCLLRRRHPALKKGLDLDAFVAASHVQIAPRGTRGGVVDDLLEKRGLRRRVALRTTDFLVAPLVVASSDLILTAPERLARVFAESHGLAVVDPPMSVPGFTMYELSHAVRRHDAAHAWLRKTIAEVGKTV
jgi:DNA-binding transcriptional LysR family regulator